MPERGETRPSDEDLLLLNPEFRKDIPQLDLHGLTAEQAEAQADMFINSEFMKGNRVVRIVHGKGTGKLQKVVSGFVSTHPLVAKSRGGEGRDQNSVIYAVLHQKD